MYLNRQQNEHDNILNSSALDTKYRNEIRLVQFLTINGHHQTLNNPIGVFLLTH